MDNNSWRAAQGQMAQGQAVAGEASAMPNAATGVAAASIDNVDWRTHLQANSRQRIVNKIMDTLKRHLPFSGQEGLQELKKIAVRFEEKIYTAETSQADYLRKISLKMLTMETKSQNPRAPLGTRPLHFSAHGPGTARHRGPTLLGTRRRRFSAHGPGTARHKAPALLGTRPSLGAANSNPPDPAHDMI